MRCSFLVLFLVFGSACAAFAPTDVVVTGVPREALTKNHPVQLFIAEAPETPFQEIGVVEVRSSRLSWSVDWAKDEARRLGANALVLLSSAQELETNAVVHRHSTTTVSDAQGRPLGTVRSRTPEQQIESRNVYRFKIGVLSDER